VIKRCKKIIISGLCAAMFLCLPAFALATEAEVDTSNNQAIGEANTSAAGNDNIGISIGAEITGGSQNVAVGYSTQVINGSLNNAENYGALIIGGGTGNTAIGTNAQVINGTSLEAVGYGAAAGWGNNNTAIGNHAYAGGNVYDRPTPSDNNVAIGHYAEAYGGSSVAIGDHSIANEANTVSVGQPDYERRIMNVAPGYYDTDAVNMSQLRSLDSKVNRVGSIAIAMSGLAPLPYDPKDPTQYSAAYGTYNGTGAVALGVYHYTKPTVMYNMAVAMSDDRWEKSARFGVTWRTGGAKPKPLTPTTIKKTDEETIDSGVKIILADRVGAK
jgi:hypothetical protein